MTKLKMCGLWREEDIACANALIPDYIGFVFAPSPRQVSKEQAKYLKSLLHPQIQAVGVFVDMDLGQIIKLVESGVIDVIQLHDSHLRESESEEIFDQREAKIHFLRSRVKAQIFKAIATTSVRAILIQEQSLADMLLLDNAKGGSGEQFDWEYIQQAREQGFKRDFFLAGGINASNLSKAISFKPYGIDLSKGIESNRHKDCQKMREIADRTRLF
ncbi:phosphoribosylanthranilate isomerase [Helicobacter sp.]|uniref:phosphoribosylanthranilate isomerase n=1 Tax=Helicobacter sp. TaxID=218 RepID=UPI0025C52F82|nr:phosphoribosylanthranilate isomerase [Helicobacter sp.]MBR2494408.1 phosphoribosylanthranilate isomerase [Helicobacter sp.]